MESNGYKTLFMRLLLFIIAFSVYFSGFSQGEEIGRYRAYSFGSGKKMPEDDSLKNANILIIINEYRVVVYAHEKMTFDIAKNIYSKELLIQFDTLKINLFKSVDHKGRECDVRLVYINKELDRVMLEYPSYNAKYLVHKISEP